MLLTVTKVLFFDGNGRGWGDLLFDSEESIIERH